MDANTVQLIERLAAKLGTTAEHLWGVLVRQAPIDGATTLGACVAALAIAAVMFIVAARRWNELDDLVLAALVMIGATVAFVAAIALAANSPMIAAAFFNPEYWALKQILK